MVDARAALTNFSQQLGEHLYEAWERFKLLVRQSPGHNFEKWVLLQIFCTRLTPESKSELNAVTNGGITKQPVNHVWTCLDDLSADFIQNNNERRLVKSLEKGNEDTSKLVEMLSAINKRFDHLEAQVNRSNSGHTRVNAIYVPCDYCGEGHAHGQCLISQVESVNYAGNYRGNNQSNPHSNTYTSGWHNNPNLSWKYGATLNEASPSNTKPVSPPGFYQLEKEAKPSQESKSDLQALMSQLLTFQLKNSQDQAAINASVDSSIKNLEVQMGQIATVVNALQQRGLPSTTVSNPRREGKEECKAISLRSGKELPEIQQSTKKPSGSDGSEIPKAVVENDEESITKSEVKRKATTPEKLKWTPPLPFPQRFQKKAFDEQYKKFLEIFKQLHINIPLIEALEQMPKYARYLKEMLSKKNHFTEFATVALTKEITSVIKPDIPLKCKDPGSFTIPCVLGDNFERRALCDLGSAVNLMPLSLFKELKLGVADPTTITLQLADQRLSYPYGIIKDVLVKVGSFIFPADFIVLDIEEDKEIPLIVGRPFLATARALVNVEEGEIVLRVGDEQLKIKKDKVMEPQHEFQQCARVVVIDDLNQSNLGSSAVKEPLKAIFIEKNVVENAYRQSEQALNTSATFLAIPWHCLLQPP